MNREELAQLVTLTLDAHWPESEEYALDTAVAYLVEAFWPVLAQMWDEGFSEAERHVERDAPIRNPYGDSA